MNLKNIIILIIVILLVGLLAYGILGFNQFPKIENETSSQSGTGRSRTDMETLRDDANFVEFNNLFLKYENKQMGTAVKELIDQCIENGEKYINDVAGIPNVYFDKALGEENVFIPYTECKIDNSLITPENDFKELTEELTVSETQPKSSDHIGKTSNAYLEKLKLIKEEIEDEHEYFVIVNTKGNYNFVNTIAILYDENAKVDESIYSMRSLLYMKSGRIMKDKPIIYIYSKEDNTNVRVTLGKPELITTSYPEYNDGWEVIANKDGSLKLLDSDREYYALYWEGKTYQKQEIAEGFCIKGEDSASFLEDKLRVLGLNDREVEEFIVYWLPKLEENKYNLIRFETMEEINEYMPLDINPVPDTIIRVLMDFKGVDEYVEVKEQPLQEVTRNGYTVVEWGGSEIK